MSRERTRSRIGQKKSNRDAGQHLEHSGASTAHWSGPRWAGEADQAGLPDAEVALKGLMVGGHLLASVPRAEWTGFWKGVFMRHLHVPHTFPVLHVVLLRIKYSSSKGSILDCFECSEFRYSVL